jgi:hypothetical protein
MLICKIASAEILNETYNWRTKQGPRTRIDILDLRRDWKKIKPALQKKLL